MEVKGSGIKGQILVKVDAHGAFVLISKELSLQHLVTGSHILRLELVIPFVAGSAGGPVATAADLFASILLVLEGGVEVFTPFALDTLLVFLRCRCDGGLLVTICVEDWFTGCVESGDMVH